jgi:hypothetical protein
MASEETEETEPIGVQEGFHVSQIPYTALVLVLLAAAAGPFESAAAQTDSLSVRREIRRAAIDYERGLRRFAPYRPGTSASHCDEYVGRFCLFYDAGTGLPLPPEPKGVERVRERVIAAFTAALDHWPGDTLVAGPLVRFLVEGRREADAVAAARRFASASRDSVWGPLLLGFALHAQGATGEAQAAFDSAISRMRPSEQEDWLDVRYLLALSERPKYRELRGDVRARYEGRLWRLADPLYLTDGNETRSEHLARQVYGRILARAPVVLGSHSWAEDLDELTARFGVPKARTQDHSGTMNPLEPRITEHYDPAQLTYVPPELFVNDGITLFEPGAAWPYDTIRARSGYAPTTVRRMNVLEHQISRFPTGDSIVLRADLRFPLDTAVRKPARVELGLFVLDSAFQIMRSARDTIIVTGDTAVGTISMRLPEVGVVAYSLEARDLDSRLAARARYLMPLPLISRPILSDLVILSGRDDAPPRSRQSPAFRPLPSLRIRRTDPIAIYVEARGLTPDSERLIRYRVDLEVLEQDRPSAVGAAVRRLGKALGLGGDDVAPRITWTEQSQSAAMIPIALKLGRLQLDRGLKRFRITVTDEDSGLSATIDRLVRID